MCTNSQTDYIYEHVGRLQRRLFLGAQYFLLSNCNQQKKVQKKTKQLDHSCHQEREVLENAKIFFSHTFNVHRTDGACCPLSTGEIFQASLKEVDHSLLLHSRSRFEVKSVSQCAQKCRADSMCLAFNFQHSSSSSLRQCELKDASRNQDPTNYVKRRGYTYYEDVGGGL